MHEVNSFIVLESRQQGCGIEEVVDVFVSYPEIIFR
jgi:hypothetical protein